MISCNFEMPMDCGFVVRTISGGYQWSLNQGKSFEGRLYGPPMDHTTGTADGKINFRRENGFRITVLLFYS